MSYRIKAENILSKLISRVSHSSMKSFYSNIIKVEDINFVCLKLYEEAPNGQTINYETQIIYIPIYNLSIGNQHKSIIENIIRLLIYKEQLIKNDESEFSNNILYHNDKFTIYLYSLLVLHDLNSMRDFSLKQILSFINDDCLRFAANFDNLFRDNYIKFLMNLTEKNRELFFKYLKDNIILEILEGKE